MLWWTRNRKAAEGIQISTEQVVDAAKSYLDEFLLHLGKMESTIGIRTPSRWTPPDIGFIKINYHGALFQESSEISIGIIARDSNGLCVGWMSRRLYLKATPEITETLVAREAIMFGIRRGWKKITLEGDCATLYHKLKRHDPFRTSPLPALSLQILSIVSLNWSLSPFLSFVDWLIKWPIHLHVGLLVHLRVMITFPIMQEL
ncbi:UNVERIFIED_CONTAM: hypothetical protein Sradi_1763100 [Sesamum radiatum]|uniref:RNase H type-1 domain-containing protein n=1 Tax=Sesamum radiatum TaxID=300843 RepID=A0AAW2TUS0_SESRA